MKLLTNENVVSYYKYMDDLLGNASVSNVKEENIDLICTSLKEQIDQLCESIKNQLKLNLPASATLFHKFLLDVGLGLAQNEASKYLEERTEPDCNLRYSQENNEYRIWIIALMTSSWVITNWRKKTEDGHCQNKLHWPDKQHTFCQKVSSIKKFIMNV